VIFNVFMAPILPYMDRWNWKAKKKKQEEINIVWYYFFTCHQCQNMSILILSTIFFPRFCCVFWEIYIRWWLTYLLSTFIYIDCLVRSGNRHKGINVNVRYMFHVLQFRENFSILVEDYDRCRVSSKKVSSVSTMSCVISSNPFKFIWTPYLNSTCDFTFKLHTR